MARITVILLALVGAILPGHADATPEFPGVIQSYLQLSSPPPCTICHVGTPALGNASTPFAETLKSYGLQPYNDGSLQTALGDIKAANTSSVGDGVSDIQKLENGEDPNSVVGDGGSTLPAPFPPPDYGCQIGRVNASQASGMYSLGVLALAIGLRRRSNSRGNKPAK